MEPKDKVSTRLKVLSCLVLAIWTAGVYSSVARCSFAFADDGDYILGNYHIRAGLTWRTFTWAVTTLKTPAGYPHPLTWLSHALDVQLYGLNPAGHHLTNLALHMINVVILFLLLQLATGAIGRSFVVAALFAIHPLNVESVAWIAERKNVLSTLFFLLTLGAYGWYAAKPSVRRYLGVVGLFVLGLASKPMVITLPCVLLLLDFWPLKRIEGWPRAPRQPVIDRTTWRRMNPNRRRKRPVAPSESSDHETRFSIVKASFSQLVLEKLPLLPLCVCNAIASVIGQRNMYHWASANADPVQLGTFASVVGLENAICSYLRYIWKAIWPTNLVFCYPMLAVEAWELGLAVVFLAAVSLWTWRARFSRPYLLIGWLWYLGILVPASGIVYVGDYSMADRYTYIPLIGVFVMVVWGIGDWAEQNNVKLKSAAALILVVLSCVTWHQIGYWGDVFRQMAHVQQVVGADAKGRVSQFTHAVEDVRLHPLDLAAHLNLANALFIDYRIEAVPEYETALRLTAEPGLRTTLYYNIADTFYLFRRYSEARENYFEVRKSWQKVLQSDPQQSSVMLQASSEYLQADPTPGRYIMQGILLQELGRFSEASTAFEKAQRLDPLLDSSVWGSPSAQAIAASTRLAGASELSERR